ncbi:efflux RND transporter periplasmic adaptor subunit [Mucisphaera sp.]|uniref:efflux RND transporter periplasmic adaptor subunit n=1 Tax=Mucisphaera sp. TaxID=2913024 RepID=UPI003D0D7969
MINASHLTCGWIALILLAVSGCSRDTPEPQAPPPREVEAVQIRPADLPVSVEFVGRTASSQRVEIRSRVNGFLDSIEYTEGTVVEEGQILFQIDPLPFEAQVRAAKAELALQTARMENAKAFLARVEPLAEIEAVAQKELDDARSQVNETSAAVEAAQASLFAAELDLGYATIKAPLSGITGQANQREGSYLGLGSQPLTYVARIDPIWVEFSVSETQALRSRRAARDGEVVYPENDEFEVEIVMADGTLHPEVGQLSFADASIDEQTGTFLVRAVIPNTDQSLRPGQYVRAIIKGAFRPDALVVPKQAVQQSPKGPFLWLVTNDNKAEQRPIDTGPWVGDNWVINSGVNPGDRVIVAGTVGLTPGAPVSVVSLTSTSDNLTSRD